MNEIKAFVGHSFMPEDKDVVGCFLEFLDEVAKLHPHFSWTHAERAESIGIDEKVLSILADRNVFIGICTKRERVIPDDVTLAKYRWSRRNRVEPIWKTSDWIIQEIGLAIGRDCKLILLVEAGVRPPGGLQGTLEYILFDRSAPEKAFQKLSQMIANIAPVNTTVAIAGAQSANATEQHRPLPTPDSDWNTPKPDWGQREYQYAFRWALMHDDESMANNIDQGYQTTSNANEGDNRVEWLAFREYARINDGKNGNIHKIQALALEHPHCGMILFHLARSFERFTQFNDAARCYREAAEKTIEPTLHAECLGRAVLAHAYAKAGVDVVAGAVSVLKTYVRENNLSDNEVLLVLKQLAEINKDTQAAIAITQRLVELDPSDADTRFSLAFKHAESGNDELALYHYLLIQSAERTSTTWNNIGVAFDRVNLPAKSVDAYQKAKDEGDTLAMSNLAFKCLSAGFLVQARGLIEDALKLPNPHGNIPRALAQLEEQQENESALLAKIVDRCGKMNRFYNELGAAMVRTPTHELSGRWKGPECELQVTVDGELFTAKGEYEWSTNALFGLGAISTFALRTPTMELWKIEYEGVMRGCAVEADVYTQRADETPTAVAKAGSARKVLMKLSEDERELQVMVLLKDQMWTFNKITRCAEPSVR